MQIPRLSDTETDQVRHALAKWHAERGPQILGSQLGLLIFQITARPVRELGGVRSLSEQELKDFIGISESQQHSPDLTFSLRSADVSQMHREAIVPQDPAPASFELWRFFSNPKLVGCIAANAMGRVILGPVNTELPDDFVPLIKPSANEYQQLAREFSSRQVEEVRRHLSEAFVHPDFYNEWIRRLRILSSGEENFLQKWESVKAEFVAKRLNEQLAKTGMEPTRAADLIAQERTRKAPRVVPTQIQSGLKISQQQNAPALDGVDFRQAIHSVIDLMSIEELRRLPLSAGLLYDASRRILK